MPYLIPTPAKAPSVLVGAVEQLPVSVSLSSYLGLPYFQKFCFWREPGLRFHSFLASTRVPPLPRDWEPASKASTTRRSRG